MIKLEIIDIKVEIQTGENLNWKFENCEPDHFVIEQNEKEIIFRQKEKCLQNTINLPFSKFPKLKIEIPSNIKDIFADILNGFIVLKKLNVDKILINIKNGKVKLDVVEAFDVEINGHNGIVNVENILVHKKCNLNLKNGILKVKKIINEDFGYKISCNNGISNIFSHKFSKNQEKVGFPFYEIKCINGILKVK